MAVQSCPSFTVQPLTPAVLGPNVGVALGDRSREPSPPRGPGGAGPSRQAESRMTFGQVSEGTARLSHGRDS